MTEPSVTSAVRQVRLPRHRLRSWAAAVYKRSKIQPPVAPPTQPVKVVCISDTHNTKPDIPSGDLLLHAGDLTEWGTFDEIQDQLHWLNSQPHRHKIIIAGNHDILFDDSFIDRNVERFGDYRSAGKTAEDLDFGSLIYLQDEAVTVVVPVASDEKHGPSDRKLKIYGCPTTPLYGLSAFQKPRDEDIWSGKVPKDTDILLTHGPPYRHLDGGLFSGCQFLAQELARVRPRLVVFGHIHVGHGREDIILDPVRAGYEGIIGYWEGWLTLLLMAIRIAFGYITPNRDKQVTTLVNAAVVGGEKNTFAMEPTVVEI